MITGDREARLSFTGALSGVPPEAEPVLVMDIGGGSTELIVGSAAGEMQHAVSLDIGSVRLTERFLKAGPPAAEAVAAATAYIDDLLDPVGGRLLLRPNLDRGGRDRHHPGRGLPGAAAVRPGTGARRIDPVRPGWPRCWSSCAG